MSVSMEAIKKLREKTGAGVMDAKRALEDSKGDMKKAEQWIAQKGLARAEKKSDRETAQGRICVYIHHDGTSGAIVRVLCETDFVAKTDDLEKIGREVAMQVTSMQPETVEELLDQVYMRNPKQTVSEFVKQSAARLGENVKIGSFKRMSI